MPTLLPKSSSFHRLILFCFIITTSLLQNAYAGQKPGAELLDSDHDNVPDIRDKCPDTLQVYKVDPNSRIAPLFEQKHLVKKPISVTVDSDGCAADKDGDGVPDHQDYCLENTRLEISAGVTKHGCPLQSDGDGTPDYRDRCPGTTRGIPTDRFGCPKK